ncbi:hypothetical protein SESBI_32338 [Sesbania bispinosa]|nr:hypothetical protein SESBI_32338 [Sesbania bispinosa]
MLLKTYIARKGRIGSVGNRGLQLTGGEGKGRRGSGEIFISFPSPRTAASPLIAHFSPFSKTAAAAAPLFLLKEQPLPPSSDLQPPSRSAAPRVVASPRFRRTEGPSRFRAATPFRSVVAVPYSSFNRLRSAAPFNSCQWILGEAHNNPGLHAAAGPGLVEECATLV